MRLWHKDLISVLPRQQLLGQWRECCAIARNITAKGTPNHILVNRIMEYPKDHFIFYALMVYSEMKRRGYAADWKKFINCMGDVKTNKYVMHSKLYGNWHNNTYLTECYYNLMEKYECGGMTREEWEPIERLYLRHFQMDVVYW